MLWAKFLSLNWRRVLRGAGLILGGAIFLYQVVSGFSAVLQLTIQADFAMRLAAATVLVIIANTVQIFIWSLMLQSIGIRMPFERAFYGYLSSSLARYIPGGIWGYVSRNEWLSQNYGVSYGQANLVSLLEIIGLLVAAGGIIGVYYTEVHLLATDFSIWLVYLALLFLLALLSEGLRRMIARRSSPIPPAISRRLIAVGLGASLPLYTTVWICLGGSVYLFMNSTQDPWHAHILGATFIYAISWVIGFLLIFVPAGLGVRELSMAQLFVLEFGAAVDYANGVSVIARVVGLLGELFGLGIAVLLNYRRKRTEENGPLPSTLNTNGRSPHDRDVRE